MLQSGKFKEGVESILEWLGDTEDMVANQKPPSVDYQVAKAQMQEQKIVQRLLDDRAPGINSVKAVGDEIAKQGDDEEKEQVEEQLADLGARWQKLKNTVDNRSKALDDTLKAAKQFHDKIEPMLEWLDGTEKKMAALDNVATEPRKIVEQINTQKALDADISSHKPEVEDVVFTGLELLKHSSTEDLSTIQDKIDNVKSRYGDLTDNSKERLDQMEQALPLAEEFQDNHSKLLDWMHQMEPELRGKEPIGPDAEKQVEVRLLMPKMYKKYLVLLAYIPPLYPENPSVEGGSIWLLQKVTVSCYDNNNNNIT